MLGELLVIAEDTESLHGLQRLLIKKNINRIKVIENGYKALEWLGDGQPRLIIIDQIPHIDEVDLSRKIRKKTLAPIFLLSSTLDKETMITCYEAGINDYIIKPVDLAILAAKAHASMKSSLRLENKEKISEKPLNFNEIEIDQINYTVKVRGKRIPLIAKELKILFQLIEKPNHVYSAEQIYKKVWGVESYGDARTVMVHISNLRRKMERDPSNPEYIRTVRGFGYKFHHFT